MDFVNFADCAGFGAIGRVGDNGRGHALLNLKEMSIPHCHVATQVAWRRSMLHRRRSMLQRRRPMLQRRPRGLLIATSPILP